MKILENSDTKLHMISLAKVKEVPYCDSFAVEEEYYVLSPSPTAPCSVMRITSRIIWYKSTMFKNKIYTNALKQGRIFWVEFAEWIKKRNLYFKERKPSQNPGKLKHGIEKSNKLFEKPGAPEAAQLVPAGELTMQEKAMDYLQFAVAWAQNNRTDTLLIVLLLFVFRMYLQLWSIQNQLSSL